MTHEGHAPARDTNIPTIHFATERSRPRVLNSHHDERLMRRHYGSCVRFLVANPRSLTVRGKFYVRGIDRRRAMFYRVAEKWHSVTPPISLAVDALRWRHPLQKNVHPIASALSGCRERKALFRTFFIFTLFMSPIHMKRDLLFDHFI